jgi:hypothetical protein
VKYKPKPSLVPSLRSHRAYVIVALVLALTPSLVSEKTGGKASRPF